MRRGHLLDSTVGPAPKSAEMSRILRGILRKAPLPLVVGALCLGCELIAPLPDLNEVEPVPEPQVCGGLDLSKVKTREVDGATLEWSVAAVPLSGVGECIYMDKTEVTVQDYGEWADAHPTFDDWDSLRCPGWKTDGPSNPAANEDDECVQGIDSDEYDPFALEKPIRCVDWCDAEAFCRSQRGGRLCYRQGGGGGFYPANRPDEWTSACSNTGSTVWPWGDEDEPERCNVDQPNGGCGTGVSFSCGPAAVGSLADCRNANGISDLVGNVKEWIAQCDGVDPLSASSRCHVLGSSYNSALDMLGCADYLGGPQAQSTHSSEIGFRCCYDLTPQERQEAGLQ